MWPMGVRRVTIQGHERGLVFADGEFKDLLRPGRHWIVDPVRRVCLDVVSVRTVLFEHPHLEAIVRSGALDADAEVVRVAEHQRAVVWIGTRVERVLEPGLHVLWTAYREVNVDIVDSRVFRSDQENLAS